MLIGSNQKQYTRAVERKRMERSCFVFWSFSSFFWSTPGPRVFLRVSLNNCFTSLDTFKSVDARLRFVTQHTTTPVTTDFIVTIVEVRLDRFDDFAQAGFIVRVHVGQRQRRARFQVHETTETSFALDDAVWNAHLTAQCGQVENELNGLDIVGDDHLSEKK